MSVRRLLGAHLPAASPERRETVAGECLGCQTQFVIDVRLPLPATCPDCGADVLASADIKGEARRSCRIWEPAAVAARVDLHGSGPRNTRAEHPVASRRGTREIRRRADVRREFSRIHGSIGR